MQKPLVDLWRAPVSSTVIAGMVTGVLGGVLRDGLLYGRGACDMKGGIAAAIEGMRACFDAGEPPRWSTIG